MEGADNGARDKFLQDMISLISSSASANDKNFDTVGLDLSDVHMSDAKLSASQLFRKLCFDFPDINGPDVDLKVIASAIENIISSREKGEKIKGKDANFSKVFNLNEVFMSNLDYLSSSSNTSSENKMLIASLAAVILHKLPMCMLLYCDQQEMQKLLSNDRYTCFDPDIKDLFCFICYL